VYEDCSLLNCEHCRIGDQLTVI